MAEQERIFVVGLVRGPAYWVTYYLVFAEDADKAMGKAKADCYHKRGDQLYILQEIEQGRTSFLYDTIS